MELLAPSPGPAISVTHVVLALETGGLERVVLDLCRATRAGQSIMSVVCLRHASGFVKQFEAQGTAVLVLNRPRFLSAALSLATCLRRSRPQVVHSHNLASLYVTSVARRLAGVPLHVHTRHGPDPVDRTRQRVAQRLAARWADAYVTVSEHVARQATSEGVPARRLHVIPNGVDTGQFVPPTKGGGPGGKARAVCVSRLSFLKDPWTLFEAARRVASALPGFRLDIVGDGYARETFEKLRVGMGLEEVVTLVGDRTDVRPYLADADIFLLASRSEGLSIAILEAMAMGVPAVTTNVGGNAEVIDDGRTGLLVPAGDGRALAEAALSLLQDGPRRREMGLAARRRVEERFELQRVLDAYDVLYASGLQRPSGATGG